LEAKLDQIKVGEGNGFPPLKARMPWRLNNFVKKKKVVIVVFPLVSVIATISALHRRLAKSSLSPNYTVYSTDMTSRQKVVDHIRL
jgi:hypothetical protein